MAIRLNKTGDHIQQGTVEYTADAASDIAALPTGVTPGSECFCIEESKTYILNNNGEWKEKKQGSGGGSGGGGGSSYPSADGRSFPLYNDDVTLLTQSQYYNDIAKAIQEKTGSESQLKPSEMASSIIDLPIGGMTLTEWQKIQTRRAFGQEDNSNNFSRIFAYPDNTFSTYTWGQGSVEVQGSWQMIYDFTNRSNGYGLKYILSQGERKSIEQQTLWVKNWTTWNGARGNNYGQADYPGTFSGNDTTYRQFLNLSSTSHPFLKKWFPTDDTIVLGADIYNNATFGDFFNINLTTSTDPYGMVICYHGYYNKYFVFIANQESDILTIDGNRIYINAPQDFGQVTYAYYTTVQDIDMQTLTTNWGYYDNAKTTTIFNTYDIKDSSTGEVVLAANCSLSDFDFTYTNS